MAKKFKITEAQRDALLAEGVTIKGATDANDRADISKTQQELSNTGIDPQKINVEFKGTQMSGGQTVSEHRVITKKELQSNRLRYLKENSEVLSFNNFMKQLNK